VISEFKTVISQQHTSDIGVNIGCDIGCPDILADCIRYLSHRYHSTVTSDIIQVITEITVTPILLQAGGPGLLAPTLNLKGGSPPCPGFLNLLLPHHHGHSVCHRDSHILSRWKHSTVAPHAYVDLEEPATGPTVWS
jgi:hypothetical protein